MRRFANSLERTMELLQLAGLTSEDLDELVYDAHGEIAADVNNQGLEGQADFLLGRGWDAVDFPPEEELMDELVHEDLSEAASDVNNGGINEQVIFLLHDGFSPDDILRWFD